MCGIVGISSHQRVNQEIYDALTVLQHRGQDAAGMMTVDAGQVHLRKGNGLVRDVFHTRHMLRLSGHLGIGHVRYPTAGTASQAEAQPFYVNSPYGIALAHNGNLTNAQALKELLYREDLRHINTNSDSEILLNVLAHELQQQNKLILSSQDVFNALTAVFRRCQGGFAAVAMILGYGLVAFRDPHGIRPLVFGRRSGPQGDDIMFASESVALNVLGYEVIDDVQPGEVISVNARGEVERQHCVEQATKCPCLFEHVYLARPDSIMDGISVYKARLNMGEKLAEKILRVFPKHDIDRVIPVPDTSRTAALPLAYHLGVKLREGFIKNRYIGRTFIMPGQGMRQRSVRQKLNAIESEFRDKNVLLVDDSIVRGTTSREIIQMAREAGAKNVYFASAAPPVRYPNVYGIDMPAAEELVAHQRDEAEIASILGADALFYQDLSDLIDALHERAPKAHAFDASVFNGDYVTGDIDDAYLTALAARRNDAAKATKGIDDPDIDRIDTL